MSGRELAGPEQFGHVLEAAAHREPRDVVAAIAQAVAGDLGDRRLHGDVRGAGRASRPAAQSQALNLYDDSVLGPFPADWFARAGRVVLTGEYGGKAGFRHVLDGLGIAVADGEEDLVFSLVQLCASATGKPLTDDELALIAGYPRQLALLFPGQL